MKLKLLTSLAMSVAGIAAFAPIASAQDLNVCSQESLTQIVYYEFGKSQSAETASQIQDVQGLASSCNVRSIELIGHTDTVGSAETNQRLSVRRANNMKAELVRLGVPSDLIMTSGRGETELFVPTADGTQEQLNRRVEVRFTFEPMFVQSEPVYSEPVYSEPVYSEPVVVQAEPVYVEPAPVYVEPAPVYVEPAPVYVDPTPVVEAAPIVAAEPVVPVVASQAGPSGLLVLAGGLAAATALVVLVSDDDDDEAVSP